MATKKMPTTFFLNNMTYFIKKMTLAKIYPKFSHIDTTAYTILQKQVDRPTIEHTIYYIYKATHYIDYK